MDAVQQRRRDVHDTLLPVLAEKYGDRVRVLEARNADTGAITYRLPLTDVVSDVSTVTISERAAAVFVHVRLGRCYVGYRRALHWLTCNRAGNTVTLAAREQEIAARELCVVSHRVTLPGDAEGIREQLRDVEVELARIAAGLVWFPQLVEGGRLAGFEEAVDPGLREAFGSILAHPLSFLEWAGKNKDEAMDNWGIMPAGVCGWLGRWAEQLALLDEYERRLAKEVQEANQVGYLIYRFRALGQLKRHAEVLSGCDELESLSSEWKATPRDVVARMWALNGLGQHEEALELARSAVYDGEPRVWYWRSAAQAALGQHKEGFDSLMRYEALIGQDIIARRNFRRLIPEDWQAEEEKAA